MSAAIPPMPVELLGGALQVAGEDLYGTVDDTAPPGLGRFAYRDREHQGRLYRTWYYRAPNKPWEFVYWDNLREPPPLPKPPNQRRRCGCSQQQHTCGACGQPFWVEFHQVADGYCTYCYHRG